MMAKKMTTKQKARAWDELERLLAARVSEAEEISDGVERVRGELGRAVRFGCTIDCRQARDYANACSSEVEALTLREVMDEIMDEAAWTATQS